MSGRKSYGPRWATDYERGPVRCVVVAIVLVAVGYFGTWGAAVLLGRLLAGAVQP